MGDESFSEDEKPAQTLRLPGFRIAKYPVNEFSICCVCQSKRPVLLPGHWKGNDPLAKMANHPVVNVTWYDAVAFCQWVSGCCGEPVRLPSEAEWEKAAKGDQGQRVCPWGSEEPDANRCNFDMNIGTTAPGGDLSDGKQFFRMLRHERECVGMDTQPVGEGTSINQIIGIHTIRSMDERESFSPRKR